MRPGGKLVHDSRSVERGERDRRGDGHRLAALEQQDPHVLAAGAAELGSGVVVGEDLIVRVTGVRHAVGAVLAHAHSVPVAATGDHEERLAGRGRRLLRLGSRRAAEEGEREYEEREEAQSDGPG